VGRQLVVEIGDIHLTLHVGRVFLGNALIVLDDEIALLLAGIGVSFEVSLIRPLGQGARCRESQG
jgi:hypothetical protein